MHEGKNGERCAKDLAKFDFVRIPKVDWDLTTKVTLWLSASSSSMRNQANHLIFHNIESFNN